MTEQLCLDYYPWRGWHLYLNDGNPSGHPFDKWYRTEAKARRAALKWMGKQVHLEAIEEHTAIARWNVGRIQ